MPNTQLVCDGTPGLNASFRLAALDNQGQPQPATGTATIDDYASAFLVALPGGDFQIVSKLTLTVGAPTVTVTATFNLRDAASGVALPAFTVSVDLVAPQPPPQKATHVVLTAINTGTGSGAADPGSPTINVSI